jgi:hypothetical protein
VRKSGDERDLDRHTTERFFRLHVADRWLRAKPRPVRYVIRALLVFVVVLAVLTVGQAVGTSRAGSTGESSPNPGLRPLPSALERDQAIAAVRKSAAVGRVDRADAKLMTYAEYLEGSGPVRTHEGDPRTTPTVGFVLAGEPSAHYVWVVVISGEVWPSGRSPVVFGAPANAVGTPFPPYRWSTFLVDAESAQLIVVADAGIAETWPSTFGNLPAHPVQW